jgi:hypothetical protein
MKKQILNIAATLSLLLMLGIASMAQTTREMTVNIPFAFHVGKATLPAGTYTVYRASSHTGDGYLLRDADGQSKAVFNTQQAQSHGVIEVSKLEFHRYNDQYFLAGVWSAGNNIGRELQPSRLERELAKESTPHLAQKSAKPEIVTVTNQ